MAATVFRAEDRGASSARTEMTGANGEGWARRRVRMGRRSERVMAAESERAQAATAGARWAPIIVVAMSE